MSRRKFISEADLQFEIGFMLRSISIPFHMEFTTPCGRLDIAITDGITLWAVIECKRINPHRKNFQKVRYASMGVPLIQAGFFTNLDAIIAECMNAFSSKGRPLDEIYKDPSLVVKKPNKKLSKMDRLMLYADEDLNIKQ